MSTVSHVEFVSEVWLSFSFSVVWNPGVIAWFLPYYLSFMISTITTHQSKTESFDGQMDMFIYRDFLQASIP
jgi:hypothetical protein